MPQEYSFSKKFIEGETTSGFWNLAFYGLISLNSFITLYFLSVYEYGFYQLILSIISIALSLTAGLFDDLVFTDFSRYLGRKEKDLAKRLFGEYAIFKIILAIILVAIIFLGAEIISRYYGKNIVVFLRIVSIALFLEVAQSLMNFFFRGTIYFSALKSPFIGEVGKLATILGLFWWQGLGIIQILVAYVAGQFFSFIFSGIHFIKLYKKTFEVTTAVKQFLIKDLFRVYGIWIFLRYILSRIANNIRPWIIKIFINTEAVALFSFARNIASVIMRLMPLGTFGILLPRELEDKERLRYLFSRITKYSVSLGLIFTILSIIFVPFAIKLILPKYTPAIPLFLIIVAIIFLYGFYKIFRITLVVFKEQKALFLRSFDNSILAPLMLFIFLPIFGVAGAAIEWVLTYAITTFLFYYYLVKAHPYLRLKLKNLFIIDRHDKEMAIKIFRNAKNFLKARINRNYE